MASDTKVIGEAISRIDGLLKVTGAANYGMDWPIKNVAYAFIVKSTIAAGTITDIDTVAAEKLLVGKSPTEENFRAAADAEMKAAAPLEHNKFKVELSKRAMILALKRATGKA